MVRFGNGDFVNAVKAKQGSKIIGIIGIFGVIEIFGVRNGIGVIGIV